MSDPLPADFAACLRFTLREEGGFSDNPADPGGATQKGVTLETYTAWRHAKDEPAPTVDDLRAISDDELDAIYSVEFFNPLRCHDLPRGLDLMLFDSAVNIGPKRAAIQLQRALGFNAHDVDGWVGPKTITSATRADALTLLSTLAALQQEAYFASPNYPTFGRSWLARVNRRLLVAWDMSRAATQPIALPAPVAAA